MRWAAHIAHAGCHTWVNALYFMLRASGLSVIARFAILRCVRMAAWLFRALALQGARNGIGGCS